MKPSISKNYKDFALDLDNWIDNLDKQTDDNDSVDIEDVIGGSYETTIQGVKIVFELEADRIFDFLSQDDMDILSEGKLSFITKFNSLRLLLQENSPFSHFRS